MNMKQGMKRVISVLLICLLAAGLLTACGAGGGETKSGAAKDTLNFTLRVDIASLNPLKMSSEGDSMAANAIFMPLFYYANEAGEVRSEACDSWEMAADAKTFTFKIKEGIQFHNGKPLTPEDVVYSIYAAKESPVQMVWSAFLDKAEVTGVGEVTIRLTEPNASFLHIADIFLFHEQTMKELGDDFDTNPIGCGPYKFVSFEPGYKLTLDAYKDYGGPATDFEHVVYTITTDPSAAVIAVENGESDVVLSTAFVQYEPLKANKNVGVFITDYAKEFVVMNHKIAPYDDVRVRQAISHAIDKKRCADTFSEGLAPVPTTYIAGVEDPSLVGYDYDPEKAKTLLREAGYPDGKGFPDVKIQTIDIYKTYAQIVQENLSDLGLKVSIELEEATSFTTALTSGNVPFSIIGIGLGLEPSQYYQMLVTGQPYNLAAYSNTKVDALFDKASVEIDEAKRMALYVELSKIVEKDAAYGLLSEQILMYVYNAKVNFDGAFENLTKMGIRPQDVKLAA